MVSPGEIAGNILFCCCGPKGSLCCFVLSLWGFIMLAILGGFLQAQAVALYEDIEQGLVKADTSNTSESDLISSLTYRDASNVESVYSDAAMSCYGAAVIYLFFLALSGSFIGVNIWRAKVKQQ